MLRRAITAGLAGLVGATLTAGVAESWPGTELAGVRVAECLPADQAAVFHSRMKRPPAAARMYMRFTLLESVDGQGFAPVPAPGLDRWLRSRWRVGIFGYRQRVRGLAGGASYRALVHYRWHDASGHVVRRALRRSGLCRP
jgi:hypothetical protein